MQVKAKKVKVEAKEKEVVLTEVCREDISIDIYLADKNQELRCYAKRFYGKEKKLLLEEVELECGVISVGRASFNFVFKDFVYYGECDFKRNEENIYFLEFKKDFYKTLEGQKEDLFDSSPVFDMERLSNMPLDPVDQVEMGELIQLQPKINTLGEVCVDENNGELINLEAPELSAFLIINEYKKYQVSFEDLVGEELSIVIPASCSDLEGDVCVKLIIYYIGLREEVFFDVEFQEKKVMSDSSLLAYFKVLDSDKEEVEHFFRLFQKRQEQVTKFLKGATGTE